MSDQARTDDVVVEAGLTYYRVVVRAADAQTDVWIGDDGGHLVVKEPGVIDTHLLAGDYTVEFGLGTSTYPLALKGPLELTEEAVRAGPTCQRPAFRFGG